MEKKLRRCGGDCGCVSCTAAPGQFKVAVHFQGHWSVGSINNRSSGPGPDIRSGLLVQRTDECGFEKCADIQGINLVQWFSN